MAVQKLRKAAVLETPGAALRVAPVAVHGSGVEKYGSTGVLASSADRAGRACPHSFGPTVTTSSRGKTRSLIPRFASLFTVTDRS